MLRCDPLSLKVRDSSEVSDVSGDQKILAMSTAEEIVNKEREGGGFPWHRFRYCIRMIGVLLSGFKKKISLHSGRATKTNDILEYKNFESIRIFGNKKRIL